MTLVGYLSKIFLTLEKRFSMPSKLANVGEDLYDGVLKGLTSSKARFHRGVSNFAHPRSRVRTLQLIDRPGPIYSPIPELTNNTTILTN